MASYSPSPLEVEVTVSSAKDLSSVNGLLGTLKPYAVVWVDPTSKRQTHVDYAGKTCPFWDKKLVVPVTGPIDDVNLSIEIFHSAGQSKHLLLGSTRTRLNDMVNDVGMGKQADYMLQLWPQGQVNAKIAVPEIPYRAPDPYYAPSCGAPPPPPVEEAAPVPPYGHSPVPPYVTGAPLARCPSFNSPAYGLGY